MIFGVDGGIYNDIHQFQVQFYKRLRHLPFTKLSYIPPRPKEVDYFNCEYCVSKPSMFINSNWKRLFNLW